MKNYLDYLTKLDEKFAVVHLRCPTCKVDLEQHKSVITVPTEKGPKDMPVDVSSCPKCGFIGDVS